MADRDHHRNQVEALTGLRSRDQGFDSEQAEQTLAVGNRIGDRYRQLASACSCVMVTIDVTVTWTHLPEATGPDFVQSWAMAAIGSATGGAAATSTVTVPEQFAVLATGLFLSFLRNVNKTAANATT